MRAFFYLSTCKTCQRILEELPLGEEVTLREIKSEPIKEKELEAMKELAGSYESLFSRRARKFRAQGLHERDLDEADYRKLLLEEYTFLNRPVLVLDQEIFIGSSRKEVEAAKSKLEALNNA